MKITLYLTKSKDNVLEKKLSLVEEVENVQFKEGQSINNPSVIIQTLDNTLLNRVNYAYIDATRTFYYITDVITLTGNRYQFNLKNDVLMTNKEDIKKVSGVINRSERYYDNYLIDEKSKSYARINTNVYNFPSGLTAENYILAIAGGGN